MRKVVAGNWKMHLGPAATGDYLRELGAIPDGEVAPEVLIFPPVISLAAFMGSSHRDPGIGVGVQNIHFEDRGAFTGEISAAMAREAGARYALVGHSERRHVFGESDEDVRRKMDAALRAGLVPVICVGETLEERRAGRVEDVIVGQLTAALPEGGAVSEFLVAYEPVWAIGTGETATPADASEAHGSLRACLATLCGPERAGTVPILYGGSVKPANALELMVAEEVDGVLVGGASLDPLAFRQIAEAGTEAAARS